jgi:NADPH-dependent curcumin reductase CurA
LFTLHTEGRLRLHFDAQPFQGLEDVYGAIERLISSRSIGKVVVKLGEA